MANEPEIVDVEAEGSATEPRLDGGTYEIIRNRLTSHGDTLLTRLTSLNESRRGVFGSIELALLSNERVATANNCVPRDMIPVGDLFLFGYNVHFGLRTEIGLEDVFSVYSRQDHAFRQESLDLIGDARFVSDFQELYKYYKHTRFTKFSIIGPNLFMVFRTGKAADDIKAFKWALADDGSLHYVSGRSDHEFRFPAQHAFEWIRTHRDMQRSGEHPHIAIQDRIFVETLGGDLTIKVEDNTETGEGIYSEPVKDPDQTLDDAEVFYADLGNLVLLKVRPYMEETYRYIVYCEKVQQAFRIDTIETACVLLPEDHGIIFANGYCLQTGEHKEFENDLSDMLFERQIAASNGEDYLYIFYNRESGTYVLLSYNLIEQKIATPIICHGFCLFKSGELIYFKAGDQPKKSHSIQVWRTPYVESDETAVAHKDSLLFKVGNTDVVRAMAACHGVLGLIGRDDSYANLYLDIVRQTTEAIDAYFWLAETEAFNLKEPLVGIKGAASAAVEEFEKVRHMRGAARSQVEQARAKTEGILSAIQSGRYRSIEEFVQTLTELRAVRGEIISLQDVRYADVSTIEQLDQNVQESTEQLARRCVTFLLGDDALAPYLKVVDAQTEAIEGVKKVSDARKIEEEIATLGAELEMLIDVVSNLKIDDATQRTTIIDNISSIFATLNQVRAALKNRIQELASVEGAAEFSSQIKLLNQAVINYLDVCDTPDKCDGYLSKIMIQVEGLEGKFSDFDAFIVELTEKREEIYNAFESRKLKLIEARSKKTDSLMRSAERILKGVRTRAESFDSLEQINGYFAGDLMISKVRDIIAELTALGDPIKADDVQTQAKTIREDTVRQLKDRQDLFVDGENVITFGRHNFSVNTQALDLTMVRRDGDMYLHLTGTDFLEKLTDPALLANRELWDQEVMSENASVYRGEYLAYQLMLLICDSSTPPTLGDALKLDEAELSELVQTFMAPRYTEGYIKGVHDHDAALILKTLLTMQPVIGLLRYHTRARALAIVFWQQLEASDKKTLIASKLKGFGRLGKLFPEKQEQAVYIGELQGLVAGFCEERGLFDVGLSDQAGEYLFYVLAQEGGVHPVSPEAADIDKGFATILKTRSADRDFVDACEEVAAETVAHVSLLRDWVAAFVEQDQSGLDAAYNDEVVAHRLAGGIESTRVSNISVNCVLKGLMGSHAVISKKCYNFRYSDFILKLSQFEKTIVPRFHELHALKKAIVDDAREVMRLEEFKPHVLTSFVRNRLIDNVYLPLLGDNLAKQIGVAGAGTRTDRMGLLLLISPPGYGKTTLMEYIANRLGIIFMKINGPAIGNRVTSLDPAEAPNAAAREELKKLNLSLEMGDNVMIYLDDIQHCNPELLQKFISLCDAQRKIEGIYKGRSRTYDLRGKKVAVVMAGNPYTESGEMFKVPDMLANRSDTYNLGDIIGDSADYFKLSYIENSMTSNSSLSKLATRSRKDIHGVIRIAETGSREGVELEGNYASEELAEFVSVMKKLLRIRDVILTVNLEYIRSASQADEFRTEPSFKLQGSYRNMNRIAGRASPIMNDEELEQLIFSHYENEAQTLTTGAEANLLKFKELMNQLSEADAARWAEIKRTFGRNQLFSGTDDGDRMGQAVVQLGTFREGLEDIRDCLTSGVSQLRDVHEKTAASAGKIEAGLSGDTLARIREMLGELRSESEAKIAPGPTRDPERILKLLEQQYSLMQGWTRPGEEESEHADGALVRLRKRTREAAENYRYLMREVAYGGESSELPQTKSPTP